MTGTQRKRALWRRRRRQRIKRRIACTALVAAGITAVIFIVSLAAPGQESKQLQASEAAPVLELETPTEETTEASTETEVPQIIYSMDWDADDAYILAKMAMAEAEGEDTEGKALVILTILNRVWSPQFPGTIAEVVAEENAFSSYSNGRYDRVEPDADCWAALELVQVEHWDGSRGALYFERTPEPWESTWHSRNLEKLFIHGNHTFYREKEVSGR